MYYANTYFLFHQLVETVYWDNNYFFKQTMCWQIDTHDRFSLNWAIIKTKHLVPEIRYLMPEVWEKWPLKAWDVNFNMLLNGIVLIIAIFVIYLWWNYIYAYLHTYIHIIKLENSIVQMLFIVSINCHMMQVIKTNMTLLQ